ncbi:hypothetical protein sscle_11g085420 [Sclerotinia sclerotiorum 1980 UF-70]|uniref:Uncharacterized protein n=1 Tax=Sclerotinia sclerotiorum (strain ATCC 18683 / 1980 / Ss-1) TaxID=665079 RepID=A0A1D9QG46_SCLS1|nr:hypothetical protein sscle_11g085420 [Sclerotinia sclerotiorum 1980 UF-70]
MLVLSVKYIIAGLPHPVRPSNASPVLKVRRMFLVDLWFCTYAKYTFWWNTVPGQNFGRRSEREYAEDVGGFASSVNCRQEPVGGVFDSLTRLSRGPRTWNGLDLALSLFNCLGCIAPRQWGSLDTALLRPRVVRFAEICHLNRDCGFDILSKSAPSNREIE